MARYHGNEEVEVRQHLRQERHIVQRHDARLGPVLQTPLSTPTTYKNQTAQGDYLAACAVWLVAARHCALWLGKEDGEEQQTQTVNKMERDGPWHIRKSAHVSNPPYVSLTDGATTLCLSAPLLFLDCSWHTHTRAAKGSKQEGLPQSCRPPVAQPPTPLSVRLLWEATRRHGELNQCRTEAEEVAVKQSAS